MEAFPYRTWAEVSRQRISRNFENVRAAVGPGVEIAAVVKADAYGHGAIEVSRLLEAGGARWLAVSSVEEGVSLRSAGIRTRILVMADGLPFTREAALEYGLTPVVHSLDELREFDRFAQARGVRLKCHLKIDSGMGRLGTCASAPEIAAAARDCPRVEIEGLMTHLASSADYNGPQTDSQVKAFEKLCADLCRGGLRPDFLHISSSNSVAYGRSEAWHNMIRPGHAIYGYFSPARGHAPPCILDVAPALTWRARVLAVKQLPEGALIGYGGMFRAARPTSIAILGVGYADGLSHRLSNRGRVIAAGKLAPILGAVSMDVTTIDVTDCPAIAPGDPVTLLGREGEVSINAQEMARMAGTISYDVLCGIRARVRRVYL
jgi:alanine racemase